MKSSSKKDFKNLYSNKEFLTVFKSLLFTISLSSIFDLFQIFCDGERIGTFAHRTSNPNRDYVKLNVAGDLELTGIEFSD